MELKPGYKQTEVGVIPEDWGVETLEHLSTFITKGSTPTTYGYKWQQSGVLFLRSECISEKGLDLTQSMFISSEAHLFLRRSEVKDGDILITITGNVGRVVYLKKVGQANINQHIARLRISAPLINPYYVYHFLSQVVIRKYYNSIVTGQAYPQISLKQVRETPISLPSTEAEQTAIANVLSDADALIQSLTRLIAKKRQIKQGAMQTLLNPYENGRLKVGWVVKKLGDIGVFTKGSGVRKDEAQSGSLPCIRYGEIYTRHNDYIKKFHSFISNGIAKTAKQLKKGDLLFAGSGETKEEIGKCVAFLNESVAFAGGDIVILSPISIDSLFFGYYLNTNAINKQKASMGQGDAVVHISATALANIDIAVPEESNEQTRIATILSDMGAEIAALETKLAKYRHIKQGMMQNLLTGRIRLL
ncbi:restriction endonuclease subunit S [Nitrosomonas sp.]|uniref:restriction endonuclease subunit S n=1 Tax=Nitrosomonas sp. TaxID=42353 RepID=UPI00260A047D|nr:restriction endonuclease subunit S [Nitrosomonas sp.]MCW5602149.1 restriction endonuclease subunit S [Nitrosomonas sp.]